MAKGGNSSNKLYTLEQRWIKNKKRAIAREKVRVARAKIHALHRDKLHDNTDRIDKLRQSIEHIKGGAP